MNLSVQSILKATFAVTALTLASNAAIAAGAITVQDYTVWEGEKNTIDYVGDSISVLSIGHTNVANNRQSYTGNAALDNAAWGHHGRWLAFEMSTAATTKILVEAVDSSAMSPGFTIYATNGLFDGGTGGTGEVSSKGTGIPHSFNQTGQAGAYGLLWATDTSITGGNSDNGILETLGYANSGPGQTINGWGGEVLHGAHDVSISSLYENGVSGSVGSGWASLTLLDLQPGWYALFLGGADGSLAGSPMNVTVSSVPVPAAVWLFGSALIGLVGTARRKITA